MQKLFLIAALTLALPLIAQAQESPRTEILAGYSYLRADDNDIDALDRDLNGYNISGNITVFRRWFGLKADVSGHFGDFLTNVTPRTDFQQYLFLFGPQFTLRKSERFTPFAHVLFGAARTRLDNDTTGVDITDTGFAFAAGGGVDIKALSSRLAIRLAQADYIMTRFDDPSGSGSTTSHNIRVSTGVVLRFGTVE
jgi:opacity protein-like surface antigen